MADKFKKGDTVVCAAPCPFFSIGERGVIVATDGDGSPLMQSLWTGMQHYVPDTRLHLIAAHPEPKKSKEPKGLKKVMTDIAKVVRERMLDKDTRDARRLGLEGECGKTTAGEEALLELLYQQHRGDLIKLGLEAEAAAATEKAGKKQ